MERSFRNFTAFKSMPVVGAIAFVLLLNVVLQIWDPMKNLNPDKVPVPHTWSWWAVRDYKTQDKPPNVVLLGSSQVMSPVWWQEAQYRQGNVELIVDHRSTFLESALHKLNPALNVRCFNFGLPGGMMSDSTMVAKALFHGERKPQVAVIGVSPREFVDNTFHCPAGTKHYQFLSRFADTSGLDSIGAPELPTRLQCWVQKAVYFKFKAKDMQLAGSSIFTEPLDKVYRHLPASPLDSEKPTDVLGALHKDELQRGFWVAKPNCPDSYLNEPWDCVRRLGKPNLRMLENQTAWLRVCLQTCKDEGVTPIILNMPISEQAKGLICPGVYDRHVAMLAQIGKDYNVSIINANELKLAKSDFTDWSHMDAGGGQQMLELVAKQIASDNKLVAKLEKLNSSIAAKQVITE